MITSNHIATISIHVNPALQNESTVIFSQVILFLPSWNTLNRDHHLGMESYYCIFCPKEITSRQEALLCNGCDKWQDWQCQTGITRELYRDTVQNKTGCDFC